MANARNLGHQKLLIEAINILMDRSLITWSPQHSMPPTHGHIVTDVAGQTSVILWHDAGYGELSISVWWQFDIEAYLGRWPVHASFSTTLPAVKRSRYPKLVGATASVWLERKEGLFIQGEPMQTFDVYTRKGVEKALADLPDVQSIGFATRGPYYL